jgi:hypothetical protein
VLAKRAWVHLYRRRIEWGRFCAALEISGGCANLISRLAISSKTNRLDERLMLVSGMQDARQKFKLALLGAARPASLYKILMARRGFGVTDPPDMIYVHLAVSDLDLPDDGGLRFHDPSTVIVDYNKTVAEGFADVTYFFITWSRGHQFLLRFSLTGSSSRIRNLTSWIPDWTLEPSHYLPVMPTGDADAIQFDHSTSSLGWYTPRVLIKDRLIYAYQGK